MTDDQYSVRINRREGIVEITGPDKSWVGDQLDKLDVVYKAAPDPEDDQDAPPGEEQFGNGKSTSRRRRTSSKRKKSTGGGTRAREKAESELPEKLTDAIQKKLENFRSEREDHFGSRQDQAAIIATFLEDELKFEGTSAEDLATVYEIMKWRAPVNARAVINNARNRNHYFRGWADGRAPLSVTGKNFGRMDSKKAKESKGS